jgi:uncharacterized protein YydD (DUF2326 family)
MVDESIAALSRFFHLMVHVCYSCEGSVNVEYDLGG